MVDRWNGNRVDQSHNLMGTDIVLSLGTRYPKLDKVCEKHTQHKGAPIILTDDDVVSLVCQVRRSSSSHTKKKKKKRRAKTGSGLTDDDGNGMVWIARSGVKKKSAKK